MDSARVISTMKTTPSLEAISAYSVGRAVVNWRIPSGAFLNKRGRPYAVIPFGVGCGTRRVCVQAVETSSTPKGAAGEQPFVEPQWLLSGNNGANGANLQGMSNGGSAAQESTSSQREDEKQSITLYYIVISTSKDDKSSLSEPNAGILLSLIGEDRNAIMHKISGTESVGEVNKTSRRFQRGGVDFITVTGPDLGRLAALWIAPEAGTWRLEKVSVTILPWSEKFGSNARLRSGDVITSDLLKEMESKGKWKGIFHLFQSNEALLGKDAWLGAAQLKPSIIQETLDVVDLEEKLLQLSLKRPRSAHYVAKVRQESMKEYENLKLSLLGFSSLLVAGGTGSLAALGRGDLAEGFLVGGVGGFLYLLLLQRAVDQLPSSTTAGIAETQVELPVSSVEDDKTPGQPMEGKVAEASSNGQGRSTGNVASPSSSRRILSGASDTGLRGRIVLVVGMALILGRLAGGGVVSTISPPVLLAGVVGFLTSKVAVVLAAFEPVSSPGDK